MIIDFLDEAYNKKSWHGPNLRSAIRGVAAQEAAWRPTPGSHNIWELTLHVAYWKYVVTRRITRARRGTFVLPGTNFFKRPVELSESAWKSDIAILETTHRNLRRAVHDAVTCLHRDALHLIRGAAAHDLYHAGQIRLLRRLFEVRSGA
ncbi:MAG: DinB family protein [Bryobacteraceae bacterium]